MATKLIDVMAALHAVGITHYDIKPENILVEYRGENMEIKLIDFGLCNIGKIDDGNEVCTVNYRPPELLCLPKSRATFEDKSVDVWSLGCVLADYVLATRFFAGDLPAQVMTSICHCLGEPSTDLAHSIGYLYPSRNRVKKEMDVLHRMITLCPDIDHEFVDLVKKMLTLNYRHRPSLENLKSHPYLKREEFHRAEEETLQRWNIKGYIAK